MTTIITYFSNSITQWMISFRTNAKHPFNKGVSNDSGDEDSIEVMVAMRNWRGGGNGVNSMLEQGAKNIKKTWLCV